MKTDYVHVVMKLCMEKIESKNNQKIKYIRSLLQKKYRQLHSQFLIEGDHLIKEAYQSGCLEEIYMVDCDYYPDFRVNKYIINSLIADTLKSTNSGSKVFGLCNFLEFNNTKLNKILIMDRISDPGNIGSMVRSAYSFGFDLILLTDNSVDIYNDKVIRSSQGAIFHIPFKYMSADEIIASLDMDLIVSDVNHGLALDKVNCERLALVVGNEGAGVSQIFRDKADVLIRIETCAFESLNVAAAAAIMMHHFRKSR